MQLLSGAWCMHPSARESCFGTLAGTTGRAEKGTGDRSCDNLGIVACSKLVFAMKREWATKKSRKKTGATPYSCTAERGACILPPGSHVLEIQHARVVERKAGEVRRMYSCEGKRRVRSIIDVPNR